MSLRTRRSPRSALISANGDTEIGRFIADAMKKVGNEGVITVEEAKSLVTELEVVEGMQFDRGYVSPVLLTNAEKMRVEMEDAYILIYEKKLSGLQELLPLLEAVVQASKPSLIIAEDVEGRRSPPSWSTSCVAASRSQRSRPPASVIAARQCSRTLRSSPVAPWSLPTLASSLRT